MINIESKINDANSFFKTLKNELGGTLTSNATEFTLQLDQKLGGGSVRSIILEEGISVFEFNLNLTQDIQITVDSLLETNVNFIYCSKGKLSHSFGIHDTVNSIETFQTSILSNITSARNTILFEKDIQIVATVISINTKYEYSTDSYWNTSLRNLFIAEQKKDYLYIGSYNLKIAESIKQLQSIQQKGLVRALLTKGIVNVILALEIDQHNRDKENTELAATTLTKTELLIIQDVIDYIDNAPALDHKIDNLVKMYGLSAAKFQEGFKLKHGLTVCEYIRSVRLRKSEELLTNTDLNISEIVYSIGFSNRSYFSKIFKEKFDCSPREYKKNKSAVSA